VDVAEAVVEAEVAWEEVACEEVALEAPVEAGVEDAAEPVPEPTTGDIDGSTVRGPKKIDHSLAAHSWVWS
jgi:hypothetical protein